MSTQDRVTMEHVKDFFSLNKVVEPLEMVPTVTGSIGFDNSDAQPIIPILHRRNRGLGYVRHFAEKDSIGQTNCSGSLDATPGLSGLNSLDILSTALGDVPAPEILKAEEAAKLYSNYYRQAVKYNASLSITKYREQILQLIDINQVIIVQGPTGCGKTTQVPQYILDHQVGLGQHCNIIITQPRKIAAISLSRRVCDERNWQLGGIIGYQVGMDSKTSLDTRITYVTTGVLLQKLVNNRRMDMYTHIILDEVHERDQNTDFALLVVKKLLRTNSKRVKVILMSATIDPSIFSKYFTSPGNNDKASVIEIEGKSKEVTEHYLQELSALGIEIPDQDEFNPSIPDCLYDLVVKLMFVFDKLEKEEQNTPAKFDYAPVRGSVLIFLPGYEEISTLKNKLKPASVNRKYLILPLHSSITLEEQKQVFQPPQHSKRKVILSTNISESSITVPDIKYVIDFCMTKNLVCDQDTNYVSLKLEWASKSNCIQRKGRAGRLDIGRVYRMVTRSFYEHCLPKYNVPEMKRCPLTQLVLAAKKLNMGEPHALLSLAIDPPDLCDIENAILTLKEVGALTVTVNGVMSPYNGELTFVGEVMTALPLDVRVSKLILLGYAFDCLNDCIIIAACLSLKNFFSKPFQKFLNSYRSILAWADGTFSDCLAYLQAYGIWKDLSIQGHFNRPGGITEPDWGNQFFIQIRRIKEVDELVTEIKKRLENKNISVPPQRSDKDKNMEFLILKIVIAGAFFPHYFVQTDIEEKELAKQTSCGDPLTTVMISGLPPGHGILYYNNLYMMLVACCSRMTIEFDDRKAYVQFDRRALDDGDAPESSKGASIHPAVYAAVKMRELRTEMRLQVFEKEAADNMVTQLLNIQRHQDNVENRKLLTNNRMTVQTTSHAVRPIELPPINKLVIQIFITHIVNCGHFWARYFNQETNTWMNFLEQTINMHKGTNLLPLRERASRGMLVLAPYRENNSSEIFYYRATVEEIYREGMDVGVFFIDYGNSQKTTVAELREIDPQLTSIPALAIECKLCEVKPSELRSSQSCWSTKSNDWFQRKVNGKTLQAKVYSVIQNVVRLEIYITKSDGSHISMSINEELRQLGFAEAAEESVISTQNYEERMRADGIALQLPANFSSIHRHFTPSELSNPSEIKKTHNVVHLRGPFSPLEVGYMGLTYIDQTKVVKIDRDSVNSVSLNAEPQAKHPQMLVACSVSLSAKSNFLTVRQTTLMPRIKGLLSLLSLIFTPYAELRTNPARTMHTGALCGLGFDACTGQSIYPEHGIEVEFDVEIDYIDLKKINLIRSLINMLFGQGDDIGKIMIEKSQKKLRENLLALMKRNRRACEPHSFNGRHRWMQLPSEHILSPDPEKHGIEQHVLTLHNCVNLSGENSYNNVLKRQIKELYKISGSSEKTEEFECWLCGSTLGNRKAVLLHLDTKEHQRNEAEFIR